MKKSVAEQIYACRFGIFFASPNVCEVCEKIYANGGVEAKKRDSKEMEIIPADKLCAYLADLLDGKT